jgi:antitoxin (DNA-binding transcriptional repressor) of toxin-antitoxin stability system
VAKIVNMHDAKTHLSKLVEEAMGGEEIILARSGKPAVRPGSSRQAPPARRLEGSGEGGG